MSVSLEEYMEKEVDYAIANMKNAEQGIKETMDAFIALVTGYNIDLSNFAELKENYNKRLAEIDGVKEMSMFHNIKNITVYLELLTENINTTIRTFPTRNKRLIQEAATVSLKNASSSSSSS
ncbi:Biogenesis of lysosome-related organelles complex 1 subunit 2 [Caenorhabditis elegans]|uniref:Biogenesis of lysosome-related organelles complex 1 subunit 2 n=1 Tax=Caenorhabditis elegans TaxID=6239 RepID=Q565B9_CAEEL|nr:Biogenesis of lysosome-related organelles complex 1 subunit 2 [Caenorhabditis elegans]CAI79183.1 Biogenesis of lysosome-related organelles complex 1 subunit 2 [Caenorhabditis elegans]|eukprot:NP_001024939.1 Uncharacterized protein CELE_W04G3.11 [Caenorhabditis elegans]